MAFGNPVGIRANLAIKKQTKFHKILFLLKVVLLVALAVSIKPFVSGFNRTCERSMYSYVVECDRHVFGTMH